MSTLQIIFLNILNLKKRRALFGIINKYSTCLVEELNGQYGFYYELTQVRLGSRIKHFQKCDQKYIGCLPASIY